VTIVRTKQLTLTVGLLLGAATLAFVGASAGSAADVTASSVKSSHATAPRPIASRPTSKRAWHARVLYPVWARKAPRGNARRARKLSPFAPYNRGPQQLLVLKASTSVRYGVWYLVRLPFRPNKAAAWVPAQALKVRATPWRVKVDVSARRAALYRGGRRVRLFKVAVGQSAFPTPTGRFAISEIVRQRNPRGFFGPYIMTLSAHSDRLNFFDGGRGRVAMHGTSRPRLLGTAASHGCVRLGNGAISYIARRVPPGTPVDVVP
jgi:lipoprotein-anchoring transpeptidase ErfK/SrfK